MLNNQKSVFFLVLGILVLWFVYIERAIFTPFIIAAVFAYFFNPVVTYVTKKVKIPRSLAIVCIYAVITTILVIGSIVFSSRVITESSELRGFIRMSLIQAQLQLRNLPDWLQPTVKDLLIALQKSQALGILSGQSLFPLFSQALTRVISFFIFLFSAFYLLKDGGRSIEKLLARAPSQYKVDIEILFRKINAILGGYLRGQIFLVFLMSALTYLALFILGIRFAFLLGLFSGFAEIIPVIGPITAGSVAVAVALLTSTANFGLSPLSTGIIIAIVYFVLRQLEDYFVIPYVYGKITKLPPFVIFFAVIAGGHLAGTLGLIIAVPVAAILRLLFEFSFEHFVGKGSRK